MRCLRSVIPFTVLVLSLPAGAQPRGKSPYTIDFDQNDVRMPEKSKDGQDGVYVRVKFTISLNGENTKSVADEYKLRIEENGKIVAEVNPPRSTTVSTDLSVILAIDTSGSMKEHNRMTMARTAAETFLSKLPAAADCGLSTPKIKGLPTAASAFVDMIPATGRISLIPFGSRVDTPRAFTGNKLKLKEYIVGLTPGGETAMLDAVYTGIGALEADAAA